MKEGHPANTGWPSKHPDSTLVKIHKNEGRANPFIRYGRPDRFPDIAIENTRNISRIRPTGNFFLFVI